MVPILLWITAISYIFVLMVVGFRVWELRKKKVSIVTPNSSVGQIVEHKVDSFAFYFVSLIKSLIHQLHLYVLILGQKGAMIMKYLSTRIERRFGKVINSVKGKQELSRRGDASNFLKEIESHKESVKKGESSV